MCTIAILVRCLHVIAVKILEREQHSEQPPYATATCRRPHVRSRVDNELLAHVKRTRAQVVCVLGCSFVSLDYKVQKLVFACTKRTVAQTQSNTEFVFHNQVKVLTAFFKSILRPSPGNATRMWRCFWHAQMYL